MTERTINAERVEQLIDVFGSFDENVRKIEDAFGIKITNRNNELKVTGDEEAADKGCRAIEALLALSAKGEEIDEQKVRYLINLVNTGNEDQVSKMAKDVVCVTAKGRPLTGLPLAVTQTTSLRGPPLRQANGLASYRAICRTRLTPTCVHFTTRCSICWGRRRMESILSAEILRLRRWHICAGGHWTTALSFSTKHKTPHASGSRFFSYLS